jgi:hypothetical protein
MFTFTTYRKYLTLGALVLALCAILAPSASAYIPDPGPSATATIEPGDVGYYTHDVGATAADAGLVDESAVVRPDDRATHGVGGRLEPGDVGYYTHDVGATASDVIAVDDGVVSRPAPADGIAATQDAPVVVVAEPAPATGFDWSDAGVGIAIGLVAALLLGGLMILTRRRGTLAGA